MKITFTNDSATIGTTEYSLPADSTVLAAQTDDCVLQAWIDFSAMTSSEQYQITLYEKVNGGTALPAHPPTILTGVQASLFATPPMTLGEGWDLTVKKLSGTDRAIAWSLRKQVEGETVLLATAATTAILDKILDGATTLRGALTRMYAITVGKVDNLDGSVVAYRDDGTTTAFTTTVSNDDRTVPAGKTGD
jgi:hypothetical protein